MSSGKRCQNGRASWTVRWALRNLAVETVFIACVICWLFWTLRIRRRRSMRVGMLLQALLWKTALKALRAALISPSRAVSMCFFSRILVRMSAWSFSKCS